MRFFCTSVFIVPIIAALKMHDMHLECHHCSLGSVLDLQQRTSFPSVQTWNYPQLHRIRRLASQDIRAWAVNTCPDHSSSLLFYIRMDKRDIRAQRTRGCGCLEHLKVFRERGTAPLS
ncbi:hypothetical protein B0H66DRAFT_316707 [Apodospora peruviana]|uniref:Secreted protein n=1 Tax=Apodospora peruviana TaxID=516989 RepID=A0AAE0M0J6_9PEZI|nr:hypothetical protein B0H66DRAFT_316707 [Apodospora peruviana]